MNATESLCERITMALTRNELGEVRCEQDERGYRLTGTVASDADKAIAFALAKTTIGTGKIINSIKIQKC